MTGVLGLSSVCSSVGRPLFRTDLGEVGVAVEPVCRRGAAIGVVVGGGLVI